jgi:hypothetical protein
MGASGKAVKGRGSAPLQPVLDPVADAAGKPRWRQGLQTSILSAL